MMRGSFSCQRCIMFGVSSVEPSSAIKSSQSCTLCARMLSIVRSKSRARFHVAMMMLTFGFAIITK